MGYAIGENHMTLVYGGGNTGLMGEVARAVHEKGGRVIGIIPEALRQRERAYTEADTLLITPDMRTRKAELEAQSDAFVALPGGIGTLEEIVEIITGRYLGYHAKPIFFLNIAGFFDPLFLFFDHAASQGFIPPSNREAWGVVGSVAELITKLTQPD